MSCEGIKTRNIQNSEEELFALTEEMKAAMQEAREKAETFTRMCSIWTLSIGSILMS